MDADPWAVLTPHQQTVARAFLTEREAERRHLVIYLSGAHAYGFPSPDSDLDLKCVHITPTRDLLGLTPPEDRSDPKDRIETIDGVELDYGSNEVLPVLLGVLKGNGNYLERLLGDLALAGDRGWLSALRPLIRAVLSRRIARHYGGFATSQLRLFYDKPTAKRALYVLRTCATGRHLLATGELVTDLTKLAHLAPPELDELLAIKLRGEVAELAPDRAAGWYRRLTAAIAGVDGAVASSVLPDEPPPRAVARLDDWLRTVRLGSVTS